MTQDITPVSPFDKLKKMDKEGRECWSARDLQSPAGHSTWEYFLAAIERAMVACRNFGQDVGIHFREVTKNSFDNIGRPGKDYLVTRFGASLIFMNGDPRKPEIAAAQSYFAIKPGKQK